MRFPFSICLFIVPLKVLYPEDMARPLVLQYHLLMYCGLPCVHNMDYTVSTIEQFNNEDIGPILKVHDIQSVS